MAGLLDDYAYRGKGTREAAAGLLNLDPDVVYRSSLLPLVGMKDGSVELGYPETAIDAVRAFLTPGHAMRGGTVTNEDALNTVLTVGAGGLLARRPAGSLGAFGGPRKVPDNYTKGFFRGEKAGVLPDEYPGGAFFSRDKEYADGFARAGGQKEAREFVLDLENTFGAGGDVTIGDWAKVVSAAGDPKEAQRLVDALPIDGNWTVDRFLAVAKRQSDEPLMNGKAAYHLIERASNAPHELIKNAGFDAVDAGRDVLKLRGDGIRSADAAFDPQKRHLPNIFAGIGGAGLLAAGAIPNSDQHAE